ncbi:MAG: hypothetical protein KO202_05520 [Methanobacteriaceae archaeon]|jgi:predicted outer membrane repeat protein|nr:hypothetical protein [Methanobacteriaceae archaeon]
MNLKKILITLTVIFLIAISLNVSSAETQINIDNSISGEIVEDYDTNYLEAEVNSEEDKSTIIDNTTSGGISNIINDEANYNTIYLNPGVYSGEDNTDITIDRNITIIGNSKNNSDVVIDGSNTNRIFNITPTGSLTLKNITLINGLVNQIGDERGGSINQNGGNLTIENCAFKNNSAINFDWDKNSFGFGGAISKLNGTTIIKNSFFEDNVATGGGAISQEGGILEIENCEFISNIGNYAGASIANGEIGTIIVKNSHFKGNKIKTEGGVIAIENGELIIENSTFENNEGIMGSSIFANDGDVKIITSSFIRNTAKDGGAIYQIEGSLTIDNSRFIHNEVEDNGGAIYLKNGTLEIKDTFFHGNEALNYGGAVYHEIGDLTIEGTIFDESFVGQNDTHRGYGGAIYKRQNDIKINNSTFMENGAYYGGAINVGNKTDFDSGLYTSTITISNSIFENNTGHYGGGIFTWYGDLNILNSNFTENKGIVSGAIGIYSDTLYINNSNFISNNAMIGGAIGTEQGEIKIENSNFRLNNGTLGAAACFERGDVEIINTLFYHNEAKNGAAIYQLDGTLKIENTQFIHNEVTNNGGAIYLENGTITITDSRFHGNEALNYGGAIYHNIGDLTIEGTTFDENMVNLNQANDGYHGYGGAISKRQGTITINNSTFIDNQAIFGGSINMGELKDAKNGNTTIKALISNTQFENNNASIGAGIFTWIGETTVKKSNFNNNKGQLGSAICTQNVIFNIYDSNFTSNNATIGGAIAIEDTELYIENSIFKNNSATGEDKATIGGAIALESGKLIVNNSNFQYNTGKNGGAIGNYEADVKIINSYFYHNEAENGGAIYQEEGTITIENSRIIHNEVTNNGGAIYLENGTITITDSRFHGNEALNNGGGVYHESGKLNISNSIFDENIAVEKGGAMYHNDDDISIVDSNLYNNTAENNIGGDLYNNGDVYIKNSNFTINYILVSKNITMYYKNGTHYVILLKKVDGTVVANSTINLILNGVKRNVTTDKNGEAIVTINYIPGNYSVIASYNSTDGNISLINKITVLTTIHGKDLQKFYRNDSQFYVKILDKKGNLLVNKNVTMNINGVFYTRQTDENGIVKLNINLIPGEYIITVNNTNDGLLESYKILVLPNIIAENLVKYYRNGSQFHATILDVEGKPIANKNVTMNINGVFYTRQTDEKGIVKLNINLNPKNYTITIEHPENGLKISKNIEVLPTLISEGLNKKFGGDETYEVKVLNDLGKPLTNANVTINIHGVFYKKITDDKGIARLNINLNPGIYIATAYYNNYATSNRIIVTKD